VITIADLRDHDAPILAITMAGIRSPMSVGQLAASVEVTQPSASYHVRRMHDVGLVMVHRAGRRTVVRRNERRWATLQMAFATDDGSPA
jgi:DNA-binding transcriptional ArsR family regulator